MVEIKNLINRLKKNQTLLLKFRNNCACSIETAKSFKELDIKRHDYKSYLNLLMGKGIIRRYLSEDRYYLDEKRLMLYKMNRTKWGMVALFCILAIVFYFLSKPQI